MSHQSNTSLIFGWRGREKLEQTQYFCPPIAMPQEQFCLMEDKTLGTSPKRRASVFMSRLLDIGSTCFHPTCQQCCDTLQGFGVEAKQYVRDIERCAKDEYSLFELRLCSNRDSNSEYKSFGQSSISILLYGCCFCRDLAQNSRQKTASVQ